MRFKLKIIPTRSRRRARRLWRATFGKTAAHRHSRVLLKQIYRVL